MPRDATRTRQLLLDTAQELVIAQGFGATSVDQILDAAGSSKGAFFHHFPTKRDLAHALVARWVDGDLEMLAAGVAVAEETDDPVDRVAAFLGHFETWAETLVADDTACLYVTAVGERELLDDSTVQEVQRAVGAWRVAVSALLRDAFASLGTSPRLDPDDLADHLFTTFEGAFVLCRALRSADPMRQQLRVYRELVTSLLDRAAADDGLSGPSPG